MFLVFREKKDKRLFVPLELRDEIPDPNKDEEALFDASIQVLHYAKTNLNRLRNYVGSAAQIRKAITNPSADVEKEAWRAVKPTIYFLRDSYVTAILINELVACILKTLATGNIEKNISEHSCLLHVLGHLFIYIYDFDDLKVNNPEIQNDFSFYRRTFSRTKKRPVVDEKDGQGILSEELANRMSLFFAAPNPMFTSVKLFLSDNQNEAYYKNGESRRIRKTLIASFSEDQYDFEDSLEELEELCEDLGPLTGEEKENVLGLMGQSLVMYLQQTNASYPQKGGELSKEQMYVARFARILMSFVLLFYDHLSLVGGGAADKVSLINFKVAFAVLIDKENLWDSIEKGTGGEEATRLLNLFKYASASLSEDTKVGKKLQKLIFKRQR